MLRRGDSIDLRYVYGVVDTGFISEKCDFNRAGIVAALVQATVMPFCVLPLISTGFTTIWRWPRNRVKLAGLGFILPTV